MIHELWILLPCDVMIIDKYHSLSRNLVADYVLSVGIHTSLSNCVLIKSWNYLIVPTCSDKIFIYQFQLASFLWQWVRFVSVHVCFGSGYGFDNYFGYCKYNKWLWVLWLIYQLQYGAYAKILYVLLWFYILWSCKKVKSNCLFVSAYHLKRCLQLFWLNFHFLRLAVTWQSKMPYLQCLKH